jgi:hypothetical protein
MGKKDSDPGSASKNLSFKEIGIHNAAWKFWPRTSKLRKCNSVLLLFPWCGEKFALSPPVGRPQNIHNTPHPKKKFSAIIYLP